MSDPSPETLTPERLSELDQLAKWAAPGCYIGGGLFGEELALLLRAAQERDAEWAKAVRAESDAIGLDVKLDEARAEVSRLREDVKALAEAAEWVLHACINGDSKGGGPASMSEKEDSWVSLEAALARPGIRALLGEPSPASGPGTGIAALGGKEKA